MFASGGSVWEYWPVLLRGLGLTLAIAALSLAAGFGLGLVVGLGRTYGPRPLRLLCRVYTETFRSIPPLLLVFFAYYGLGLALGLALSPFAAAVLALSLEAGALLAEVVRSAFTALGAGQWDAARALGLRFGPTLRRVAAPQALPIMLPPTVGVLIAVLKDSSLASVIGLVEFTKAGLLVRDTTADSLGVFALLAAVYFLVNFGLSRVGRRLEAALAAPAK